MFGSSSELKYGLVLSIENGSASALIVASDATKSTLAIIYASQKLKSAKIDTAGNMGHMRDLLKNLASDIEQNGRRALALTNPKARIDAVLAVLSTPWSLTIPHNVQFEEEEPFTIDAKLMKDLQKAAESQSAENPEEQLALGTNGFELVERAVVDTKINGYDIDEPIGASGSLLDLTLVSSFVSKEMRGAVEEICDRIAPGAEIEFGTQAFSTYCVLRDTYPDDRTFGFVTVSGEATEAGVVTKDALLRVAHTAYGTETLLRDICEGQNAPEAHIRSKLCMHQEGVMDDAAIREIEGHFGEYMEQLEDTFTEVARKHAIPRNIFILSSTSFESLLSSKILEALKRASKQTHALMENSKLPIKGSSNIPDAVLGRFFHKLHLENRI